MEKKLPKIDFRRLQNNYRVTIVNDDTYEEIIQFKLSRFIVYITLSSISVIVIGLTIALISYTPLKYYIPGYGSRQSKAELQKLKIKTDSLEQAMKYKDVYLNHLKIILSGNEPQQRDTIPIQIDVKEISPD